ncbi:ATP-binding protein [uncultured Litoreibacter sp.]|uniref:AAA family ATPase n=1 Tax=uncultured Litoreibacter sp. TaxID=1392394 RepID=UPI00260F3907|nr:ATP-binding protein [uncultured Litoreibacter sp.]
MCGKIASGKSTLSARLSRNDHTVVIAEDDWLNALFSDQMSSIQDYVRCAAKLREVIAPHVIALLQAGVSVVLDFQANTTQSRDWMRGLIETSGADHMLHVLDIPDATCITRLQARNAAGDHPFAATEEQYWQLSKHFTWPDQEEGFNVVTHHDDGA